MKEKLEMILDIPLELTIEAGRKKMKLGEVLELSPGSIITLDKMEGEPLDLLVNGKKIAEGELVAADERLAFRILTIEEKAERIRSLEDA